MPKLFAGGLMIVGDSGGFLNSQRLKGIHLAIKSGILAAEAAFAALLNSEYSAERLSPTSSVLTAVRFEMSCGGSATFAKPFKADFGVG